MTVDKIKTQLDNSDIMRTDGNEFLVYLVGFSQKQVTNYIHKLNKEFKKLPYEYGAEFGYSMINDSVKTIEDAIGIAAADSATSLEAAAIICFTSSGNSVKRISKYRSKSPIIAVCFERDVERSLALQWGVTTYLSDVQNTQLNECELARRIAKEHGIKIGETIILVAGYPQGTGATNTLKIIEVR